MMRETHVSFVHEGGGLQRMAATLALHETIRHATELIVDQLEQSVLGLAMASLPSEKLIQDPVDLGTGIFTHNMHPPLRIQPAARSLRKR
jgi:hypothetical protein